MKITAKDIIDLLPIVSGRGWKMTTGQMIRDEDGRCPLCALANEIDPKSKCRVSAVAAYNDIFAGNVADWNAVNEIVSAADWKGGKLREELKQALGVKP